MIPAKDGCGVTLNVTVNVFPEPEALLAPQSKIREPLESVFTCPGLQRSFDPIIVNRLGAPR